MIDPTPAKPDPPIDPRYAIYGIVLGVLLALAGFLAFYLWSANCIA